MNTITRAQWADAAQTLILATDSEGQVMSIPVDPANSDYQRITEGIPDEAGRPGLLPIPVEPFETAGEVQ